MSEQETTPTKKITPEDKERIEQVFMKRMETQRVKPNTKKYFEAQTEFFLGAICALEIDVPVHWGISMMSGRDIVEDKRKKDGK